MDWLFGCFGGAGKKARKHAGSQKACQRPFQPLPVKVLPPSSIAITGFTSKEEEITVANSEDLLQERNCASRAPAKDAEGTIQQTSERTPEKLNKGGPWSQLDDLEEELEDLRNQIEKETIDAKKIQEETPAELKKRDKTLESRQDGTPSKGWHSWLVPSSSPPSKQLCTVPSKSQHAYGDMEAVLCSADATRAVPHSAQSPIIENKKNRDKFNSESPLMFKHGPGPQNIRHMEKKVDTSIAHPQNSVAASGRTCEDRLDFASGVNKPRSSCKDGIAEVLAKQCSTTPRNDYLKSMGSAAIASARDNSELSVPCTEGAILMHKDRPSNLEKFEVLTATLSEKETEKTIGTLGHVEQVHTVTVHAPWNGETAHWRNACNTNFEVQGTPRFSKHRYHMYESSECASHTVPQSISTMEMTESERCQSSSCHNHVLVSDQKHHDKDDEDSGGRAFFVRDDDSHFDTLMSSSSPSMDSDETLTDLSSIEESLVPSETPQSRLESVTSCKGEDSSSSFYADQSASTSSYSHGSTRNSVAQICRTAQAARYDSEFYDSEGDLSFADSSSRISAECSHLHIAGRNEQSRFVRQGNQDLIKTPNKMLQWQETPEPPNLLGVRSRPASPVLTPVENALQWRQLKRKEGNLENAFESNDTNDARSGTHCHSHDVHAFTDRSISEYTVDPKREGWDENEEPEVWGVGGCMHAQNARMDNCKVSAEPEFTQNDMSLSNWFTTPQPMKGGNFENSTTLPRCRNVQNVETESSPWTRKQVNDPCGEFTKISSDATEPCPMRVDLSLSNWLHVPFKQDEAKGSTINPGGLVMHRSPSRCINERPILGLITGDMNSNSVSRKVHWDGKGIPNTTTKYKEDQRVNWHASPFEARLERALNRKLNEVAQTTPVPNRLKSLQ